jgi:hypothetical protein
MPSTVYSLPLRRDYVSELHLLVAQRARFKCSLNPDGGSHVTAIAPLSNSVVSGRDILTQVEHASTGGKGGLPRGQRCASSMNHGPRRRPQVMRGDSHSLHVHLSSTILRIEDEREHAGVAYIVASHPRSSPCASRAALSHWSVVAPQTRQEGQSGDLSI